MEEDLTTTNVALLLEEDPGLAGQYAILKRPYNKFVDCSEKELDEAV